MDHVYDGLFPITSDSSTNPDSLWLQQQLDVLSVTTDPNYKFNILGKHFRDSEDLRIYEIIDIFFDDIHQTWVCQRRPTDDLPSTEPLTDTFTLDYVYTEFENHPDVVTQSPRISTDAIQSDAFRAQVHAAIPTMISSGALRQGDLEYIPDNAGNYTYYRRSLNKTYDECLQLIIPDDRVLKTVILNSLHDTLGHSKTHRMEQALFSRVWWPYMREDLNAFLHGCPQCQVVGTVNAKRSSAYPILRHPEVWRPWQRIFIDYAGPFPSTPEGNQYVVSAVDHFTRPL